MKYNVQYKKMAEEKVCNLEVSVEDYDELVRWLEVLYKLETIEDLQFSQLEEDLEFQILFTMILFNNRRVQYYEKR